MSVCGTLSANKFSIQGHGALGSNLTLFVENDQFKMNLGNQTLLSVTTDDAANMNNSTVTDSKITFTKSVEFTNPVTFSSTTAGLTKSSVGLTNVDNTSDANKPVSAATSAAIAALTTATTASIADAVVTTHVSDVTTAYVKEGIVSVLETTTFPNIRPIGSTTEIHSEFTDLANVTDGQIYKVDGVGGPRNFAYCTQKALLTVGESFAPTNYYPTGAPDGMGAYLRDNDTVRILYNDESLSFCSNLTTTSNGTLIGGTRVTYIDYNRTKLADFMNNTKSAQDMVVNAGNLLSNARFYNVLGCNLGPRNKTSFDAISTNPHYPLCTHEGQQVYDSTVVSKLYGPADWIIGVGCSMDILMKNQWGVSNGVANSMALWVDEYTYDVLSYSTSSTSAKTYYAFNSTISSNWWGLGAYATDLDTRTTYTIGSLGTGGFEKIVEMNSGHSNYICLIPNGYNIHVDTALTPAKLDNPNYVSGVFKKPQTVYIGLKNYKLDNTGNPVALTPQEIADKADSTYLARNGLECGQLYGFALASNASWTSYSNFEAYWGSSSLFNGSNVSGRYMAIPWKWKKTLEPSYKTEIFKWQDNPLSNANDYTSFTTNYKFWNSTDNASGTNKIEHASVDPYGGQRFIHATNRPSPPQTNPAYILMHDLTGLSTILNGLSGSQLPEYIPGTVSLVVSFNTANKANYQVNLAGGGKNKLGRFSGRSATIATEQDKVPALVDTVQWCSASNNQHWLYMAEDASSSTTSFAATSAGASASAALGDAHNACWIMPFTPNALAGKKVPLYYMSQLTGGTASSKYLQSIPAKTNVDISFNNPFDNVDKTHEYSGCWDLSGLLLKTNGSFAATSNSRIREFDSQVSINNKTLMIGTEMHYASGGVIGKNALGQGGQLLALKPKNLSY